MLVHPPLLLLHLPILPALLDMTAVLVAPGTRTQVSRRCHSDRCSTLAQVNLVVVLVVVGKHDADALSTAARLARTTALSARTPARRCPKSRCPKSLVYTDPRCFKSTVSQVSNYHGILLACKSLEMHPATHLVALTPPGPEDDPRHACNDACPTSSRC